MDATASNAFAYISPDIIYDVLRTYCKFEDLEPFDALESSWANVVRSSFRKAKFQSVCVKKGAEKQPAGYYAEWFDYGDVKRSITIEKLEKWTNFDVLTLTDVTLVPGALSEACEYQILQRVRQRVVIHVQHSHLERFKKMFDVLSLRPITDLTLRSSLCELQKGTGSSFKKLLANPSIARLTLRGHVFDSLGTPVAFVKRPNFQLLDPGTCTETAKTKALMEAAMEGWLQRTSFPSHMQRLVLNGIEQHYFVHLKGQIAVKFGLKESRSSTYRFTSVHYMEHPVDPSKRAELFFTDKNTFAEICFTSKEASVRSEFGEYADYALRKFMDEEKKDPFAR